MNYEIKSQFRLNIIFFTLLISFLNIQKRFSITLIKVQINPANTMLHVTYMLVVISYSTM